MRKPLSLLLALCLTTGVFVASAGAQTDRIPKPTLTPPTGQWSTDGLQALSLGGKIEPGDTISKATIRGLDADGNCLCTDSFGSIETNVKPYVTVDGSGNMSGSATPGQTHPDATAYAFFVRVQHADGTFDEGQSEPLPIDRDRPVIQRYELIDASTIRVVFSEPVAYRRPSDADAPSAGNPLDWVIDGSSTSVIQVSGSGNERLLDLTKTFGEDATPSARWLRLVQQGELTYRDGSGLTLNLEQQARPSIDRIPPVAPVIESIAGKAGNNAAGNSTSPNVIVGGLKDNHSAELWRESDGKPGLTADDTSIGVAQASSGKATFTGVPTDEGSNTYYAVARDAAIDEHGDYSPNRSSSASGLYLRDTSAPIGTAVSVIDGSFLRVELSEPVIGQNIASHWKVGNGTYVVHQVYGDQDVRLLQVSGVPAGTKVAYAPSGDRYVDSVGNPMPSFSLTLPQGQPVPASPSPSPSGSPSASPSGSPSASPSGSPSPPPSTSPSPSPSGSPTPPPDDDDAPVLKVQLSGTSTAPGVCREVVATLDDGTEPVAGANLGARITAGSGVFCTAGSQPKADPGATFAEGFTDSDGQVVFYVASDRTGDVTVLIWHDADNNNQPGNEETSRAIKVSFQAIGERSVTLKAARKAVKKGRKVVLRGQVIAATESCAADQFLRLKTRRKGKGRTLRFAVTRPDGKFRIKVKVRKTARYFVVAQSIGSCDKARSKPVKIRAKR